MYKNYKNLFEIITNFSQKLHYKNQPLKCKNNFTGAWSVIKEVIRKNSNQAVIWRHGVVVITTAQLHSTKPELRFCTGSNPAGGMSEICYGEDL